MNKKESKKILSELLDKVTNVYSLMHVLTEFQRLIDKKEIDKQHVLIQDAIDTLTIVEINLWVMYYNLVSGLNVGDKK